MIQKIANQFIQYQINKSIISEEDIKIYQYGYILLLETGLNIILSLGLGILMHDVLSVVIFLFCFMTLRSFSGGYHADQAWKCIVLSNICVFIMLVLVRVIHFENYSNIIFALDILIGIFIFILSPVDNQNKSLNKSEKQYYKKAVFYILAFQLVLWLLLHNGAIIILISHLMVLFSLVLSCRYKQ